MRIKFLHACERGATMTEFSLVASLVGFALITAVAYMQSSTEVGVRLASCGISESMNIYIEENGDLGAAQPTIHGTTDPSEMTCPQLVSAYGGGTWGIRNTPRP